jgi:hypothetical protein
MPRHNFISNTKIWSCQRLLHRASVRKHFWELQTKASHRVSLAKCRDAEGISENKIACCLEGKWERSYNRSWRPTVKRRRFASKLDVLHNAPGHPRNVSDLSGNIKVVFPLPNTSFPQPNDQGIIANFKSHYLHKTFWGSSGDARQMIYSESKDSGVRLTS